MDEIKNPAPREGAEQKKNDGKKPYHKFNNRRKNDRAPSNDGRIEQDNSPNGTISVKPGRYDLPPENPRGADRRSTEAPAQPRPDKPRKPKQNPANQQKRNDPDRRNADPGQRTQEKKQNERTNPPQPKVNATAPTVDAEAPATPLAAVSADTTDSTAAPTPPHPKRRPRGSRGKRNTHARDGVRGKSISSEVIEEMTEEEAAIDEYVAVAGFTDSEPETDQESGGDVRDAAGTSEEETIVPDSALAGSPAFAAAFSLPAVMTEPKTEPLETFEIVGVRFKSTGKIYYFDPDGMKFVKGDAVIVDTARGIEFGKVDLQNRRVTEREVVLPLRKVIRAATPDDIERADSNVARATEAFEVCVKKIAEHKLEMKLVDVEYTFDNSKLLFYFTADGRIDFRDLVKDLAAVFRTRIELRQIGIRDETKLIGGMGICGRPFCCKTFLSDFVQVSIKMAKEQNLSLNSVKISGACGRLMCCLRYEYDTYQEEIRRTPKVDQIVSTPDGNGTVIEVQPLAGLVRVRFIDKPELPAKVYHRDSITVIGGKNAPKPKPGNPSAESE